MSSFPHHHPLTSIFTEVPPALGAVVLLNGEPYEPSQLSRFWPSTAVSYPCVCADGASNLLHSISPAVSPPTHIVGDLDSITPAVRAHYEKRGVQILHRPSQDSNDFEKALHVAAQAAKDLPIVVLGGMRGRIDQTLANIHQLMQCAQRGLSVYWASGRDVVTVLVPGVHEVHVGCYAVCGLIPIGNAVRKVNTTGLKWDIKGTSLAFGMYNTVSSSNQSVASVVSVATSDPLLWSWQQPEN